MPPRSRRGKATFSRTLRESKRAPFWKTMVMRLRIALMPSSLEGGDLLTIDADGTRIRGEKAHQHAQGHRFAHATAAQNTEGLAAIHIKAHVL